MDRENLFEGAAVAKMNERQKAHEDCDKKSISFFNFILLSVALNKSDC